MCTAKTDCYSCTSIVFINYSDAATLLNVIGLLQFHLAVQALTRRALHTTEAPRKTYNMRINFITQRETPPLR